MTPSPSSHDCHRSSVSKYCPSGENQNIGLKIPFIECRRQSAIPISENIIVTQDDDFTVGQGGNARQLSTRRPENSECLSPSATSAQNSCQSCRGTIAHCIFVRGSSQTKNKIIVGCYYYLSLSATPYRSVLPHPSSSASGVWWEGRK